MMRNNLNEVLRIVYESRRVITGLTDVKITIWDPSSTVVVNEAVMTELGGGIYFYDTKLTSLGTYIFKADSKTASRILIDSIFVGITPGGGGAGLTADMVHMLKGLSGNVLNKKDFEEIIKRLTGTVLNIEKDVKEKKVESKESISKMSSNLEDKLNLLVNNHNIDKEVSAKIKEDIEKMNSLLEDKSLLNDISSLRKDIVGGLSEIKDGHLESIKNDIKENKSAYAGLKNDTKKVDNVIVDLKSLSQKVDNMSNLYNSISKFQEEDSTKKNEEIVSKFQLITDNISELTKVINESNLNTHKEIVNRTEQLINDMSVLKETVKDNEKSPDYFNKDILLKMDDVGKEIKEDMIQVTQSNKSSIQKLEEDINKIGNILNFLKSDKELSKLRSDLKSINKIVKEISENKPEIEVDTAIFDNKIRQIHAQIINFKSEILDKLNNLPKNEKQIDQWDVQSQLNLLKAEDG